MKYLTYLLVFTAVAFGQLLPDYTCSDTLTGMFPVYYWQPEDSTLVLRWCYGVADTGSYCSLTESDITVPEFVHPGTGVHFLPYDSLDLSQASDKLDILILYDRSEATHDRSLIPRQLSQTIDEFLQDILLHIDNSGSCFHGRIRIFFAGYASPGSYYQYYDLSSDDYFTADPDEIPEWIVNLAHEDPTSYFPSFNQDYNDPFGALLWAMDSWNSFIGVRPNAEKVIFVITNSPPRSDSLSPIHLDGSNTEIRRRLIRFAHGIPETLLGQPRQPKGIFQIFFFTPPSDFDCSFAEPYSEWRDYWDGIYTAYEDWGTEFETGDTANDYYCLPFLYLDTVDSEWVEQDSIDGDLITYRDKVFDFLHHHLVRVWYRPGTGIEEDNPELPDDFSISAWPNPFNSAVAISVSVIPGLTRPYGSSENPEIEIYDINGRIVAEIPANGSESAKPSSTNASGAYRWQPAPSLPSGIYLVRAKINNTSMEKRIILLK